MEKIQGSIPYDRSMVTQDFSVDKIAHLQSSKVIQIDQKLSKIAQ